MAGYTDIHCHVLPNLDDGAQSVEQSVEMLRIAWKNGIDKIIATPHHKEEKKNASPDTILREAEKLGRKAEQEGIGIKLYPGNELFYRGELPELLERDEVCTLAGTSYVLVEFAPWEEYAYIRNGLYRLLSFGYRPVLAHVERYSALDRHMERVDELSELGSCFQVNAATITGQSGRQAKRCALTLVRKKKIHFIATDAHSAGTRAPLLEDCLKLLGKKVDESYIQQLLTGNAEKLLKNEYI